LSLIVKGIVTGLPELPAVLPPSLLGVWARAG
jgi:hypothetical protein